MSALFYRRAFGDTEGLATLARAREPTIEDVRRRLFVAERAAGPEKPDHFYKNYLSARFGHLGAASEVPWMVLDAMARRFLERADGRLGVKGDQHEDWLGALPFVSPLAICVAFLVGEGCGPRPGTDPRSFLRDELGDTALLVPALPKLEALIEREGLNEMHMHLNGSTELDVIWPDACAHPDLFYKELRTAHGKNRRMTAELYDQIEIGMTPLDVHHRLRAARRVRHAVAAGVRASHLHPTLAPTHVNILGMMAARSLDSTVGADALYPLHRHPATTMYPAATTPTAAPADYLIEEAAWLYGSLQVASRKGPWRHQVGLGLYHNFLVMTQVARMTVQQVDQVGFDQFQKYTVLGTREKLEREYAARFRQLNVRPPHDVLRHLEGRLAPKKTVPELVDLLTLIVEGFLKFRGCPQRSAGSHRLYGTAPGCMTGGCTVGCAGPERGRPDGELALVIHFIKRVSKGASRECLDGELRADLEVQAATLGQVLDRYPLARQLIVGIDAAANELHAAPEVFARTFRSMRRKGVRHATFHVGEDFAHLTSGIRAVAEALLTLKLGAGDRIGHGTALGVSPGLWLDRTGDRVMLPIGEQLDNAVFAWATLSRTDSRMQPPHTLLATIAILSARLYGREIGASVLERAWRMRGLDIREILSIERPAGIRPGDAAATAAAATDKSLVVADRATADELRMVVECTKDALAYSAFRERHRLGAKLLELSEVVTGDLPEASLAEMQDLVLGDLNRAGVAIETLPTSNVRIGIYHDHGEHHLFRWLGLSGEPLRNLPTVCVGSDDTGIFATSLRNEYAAIWDVLHRKLGQPGDKATAIIETLNRNGAAYRFRPIRR